MVIHKEIHYHDCELEDIQAALRLGAKPSVDSEGDALPFVQTEEETVDNVRFNCTWYFSRENREEIISWIERHVLEDKYYG